jgi:hypothetical protein
MSALVGRDGWTTVCREREGRREGTYLFAVVDDGLQGSLIVHELVPQAWVNLAEGEAESADVVSEGGRCLVVVLYEEELCELRAEVYP